MKLRLADRTTSRIITYAIRIILAFDNYLKELYSLVTLLTKFDIILDIL